MEHVEKYYKIVNGDTVQSVFIEVTPGGFTVLDTTSKHIWNQQGLDTIVEKFGGDLVEIEEPEFVQLWDQHIPQISEDDLVTLSDDEQADLEKSVVEVAEGEAELVEPQPASEVTD